MYMRRATKDAGGEVQLADHRTARASAAADALDLQARLRCGPAPSPPSPPCSD